MTSALLAKAAPPRPALPIPLARVLAELMDGLAPGRVRRVPVRDAEGAVLAEPLVVPGPVPATAIALRRGFAILAADTVGAGPYSPLPLPAAPPLVEAGEALPPGTDAVLPDDAVLVTGSLAEVQDNASPGLWARRAGEDAPAGTVLRRTGERVRSTDIALAAAAGIADCAVRRPRVLLLGPAPPSPAMQLITALARAAGADVAGPDSGMDDADLVLGLGDAADRLDQFRRKGARVVAGRLALRPGDDGAALLLGNLRMLLVPDRVADALGIWLALALPVLQALAGAENSSRQALPLTRKVSSGIGMAEVVLLRIHENRFEPLATADLPLAAIAVADAWAVLPPESEGLAAGETVAAELLAR